MHAVVVGAGIVGLCTAWQLVKRGCTVTVVEAGTIPNPQAASHDHHRLLRDFYPDEPGYTARIGAALEAWDVLWDDLGTRHYVETGVLALSREKGDWTDSSRHTLDEVGFPYQELTPSELFTRYPFLDTDGVAYGLFRPRGGALMASRILTGLADWLRAHGAELRDNSPATHLEPQSGNVILAGRKAVYGDAVIVAAGVGTPALVPELSLRLEAQRGLVQYVDPPDDLKAAWAGAPCWVDLGGADDLWGIAPVAGLSLKLGCGRLGRPGDPATERTATAADATALIDAYRGRFRRIEDYAVRETVANFYVAAPNDRFAIEPLGRTWVVSADCGHGFKFGALTGSDVADAVTGARSLAAVARDMAGLAVKAA